MHIIAFLHVTTFALYKLSLHIIFIFIFTANSIQICYSTSREQLSNGNIMEYSKILQNIMEYSRSLLFHFILE